MQKSTGAKQLTMVRYFFILLLFISTSALAQTKKTTRALANSKKLVKAIFETKDSITLHKLFSTMMIHKTADGRTENREEAIRGISQNKSSYTQASMTNGYGVSSSGDSTVVKYFYKGRENKPDGSSPVYTVNLTMVWLKEKKETKLVRLETLRIE
jgi:hypothetical protein